MFSFFKKVSVDSIIADITSKVEQLRVVSEFHAAESAAHAEVIKIKQELIATADAEYARAKSIAAKPLVS